MKNFLFRVEDTFDIAGRGLILTPTISKESDLSKSAIISLIRPNGSVLVVEAFFAIPFLTFSSIEAFNTHIPGYECILQNVSKKEVPKDTEVWLN